jgi:hypothetical protein
MPPIDAPTRCADRVCRHVAQPVGRLERDFQEPQFQQFERRQPLAAGELAGLADVAIVEADHAEATRRQLPAEIVVPMDHLGAQSHDQHHWLRAGVTEDFVTKVDTIGPGNLRRLVG